jgi:hypothetical protein
MIAHVVLFEPKSTTSVADRDAFLDVMRAAFDQIESVKHSFVGLRKKVGRSYEDKIGDMAYSYASVVEFDNLRGLRDYLDHPLHLKLGQLFWENCERTMILDVDCFWVNNKKPSNDEP